MQLSNAQELVAAAERDARACSVLMNEVVGFLVDIGFGKILGMEGE